LDRFSITQCDAYAQEAAFPIGRQGLYLDVLYRAAFQPGGDGMHQPKRRAGIRALRDGKQALVLTLSNAHFYPDYGPMFGPWYDCADKIGW
jgi:hypothetical protein